jgi:ATP-binding cassette subfamily B (MDR/TAP) protein 1
MATTFKTLSLPTSDTFLDDIRRISFLFLGLGAFTLVSMTAQTALLETAAGEMTWDLKTRWFRALLRQDMAYFDLMMADVSGTAATMSSAGAKYKAGVGRKLGEGVQFFVTFVGGFVYAFYASWQASLMLLALVPIISASVLFLVHVNQSQTRLSKERTSEAASIVYTALSSIRTVLSLNAVPTMMEQYSRATTQAYHAAASRMALVGLANGSLMGSIFGLRNIVVTLYGAHLLYRQVRDDGCDPSGNHNNVDDDTNNNNTMSCSPEGADIFGALIGITLGAAGLPQISVALEAFTKARAACQPALVVMQRQVNMDNNNNRNNSNNNMEGQETTVSAVARDSTVPKEETNNGGSRNSVSLLPPYVIDSSSPLGIQPSSTMRDDIEFHNVSMAYPTRKEVLVLQDFSLSVAAGQTVALVGPSGCGKSTVISLLERFYDVTAGSITLGGIDLKELNVPWLRRRIGLVSQEPHLFRASIRENIAYGDPAGASSSSSQEQIEEAAKLANAHDFIMSFNDQYDTQVGDEGGTLRIQYLPAILL